MKTITRRIWPLLLVLACGTSLAPNTATALTDKFTLAPASHSRDKRYMDSLSAARHLPSPSTAKWVSYGSTLIPIAAGLLINAAQQDGGTSQGGDSESDHHIVSGILIGMGLLIGPSAGYVYGGCTRRGARGVLIRGIAGTAAGLTAYTIAESSEDDAFPDMSGLAGTLAMVGLGVGVMAWDAVHDLRSVESTVRAQNSKRLATTVSLAPGILPTSGTPVLIVQVRF